MDCNFTRRSALILAAPFLMFLLTADIPPLYASGAPDTAGAEQGVEKNEGGQEEKTTGVEGFIQSMGQDAIAFLSDAKLGQKEKEDRFEKILDEKYDMETIGRFCMGHYWKSLSSQQQEEYQALFKDLIVAIYAAKFSSYNGQKFVVAGTRPSGSSDIFVQSFIVPPSGEKVSVDWRVRSKDENFKIVDVYIEGVSMAITKKSEFAGVIQQEGGEGDVVLDYLRRRETQQKTPEESSKSQTSPSSEKANK